MTLLETNIYGLWGGKQTAQGTPNITPAHRLVQVAGDIAPARDDGSEAYSDLTKYGGETEWVNSVSGAGEPANEATPDELAWLHWMFHGAETVTSVVGPPTAQKHRFVPTSGRGFLGTYFARVGQSVIRRHQHNDTLITRLVVEGSTANKAVRATPRLLSLDPANIYTTDPTAAMPTDKPFLYTDGASSFTIDGTVFRGASQFTYTIDDAWDVVYADDVLAFDWQQGTPTVTVGVTLYFDAAALGYWNTLVYGTAAPVAGTKPLKRVPALGSYAADLVQKDTTGAATGRRFNPQFSNVKWAIPDAPGPAPGGGTAEVTLAGTCRQVGASAPYIIDVYTGNTTVAFTT
jgi:hypothetical protein